MTSSSIESLSIESLRETQAEFIQDWHNKYQQSSLYKGEAFDVNALLDAVRSGVLDKALVRLPKETKLGYLSDTVHWAIRRLSSVLNLTDRSKQVLREANEEEGRNGHNGMWILGSIQEGHENLSSQATYPDALARCREGVRLMTPGVWESFMLLRGGYLSEFEPTFLSPRPDGGVNMVINKRGGAFDGRSPSSEATVVDNPTDSTAALTRFMIVYDPITKSVVPTPTWYPQPR